MANNTTPKATERLTLMLPPNLAKNGEKIMQVATPRRAKAISLPIAKAISRPVTAQQLASESGFRSYSTFSTAFKKYRGITVAAWMQGVQTDK